MKRKAVSVIVIFILAALSGCSGGASGVDNNNGSTNPTQARVISFIPSGSPAGNSVYLEKVSVNKDEITLAVKVQGGVDVYAADIKINFDSSKIDYVSASEGTYLNNDGTSTAFFKNYNNGELLIGVSRTGVIPGINGDGLLAKIILKALSVHINTNIVFTSSSHLLNSNILGNANISGTAWLGGSLSYQ
ncbi:MAG: cohesin domain-containing protein [bacterium]|nr:cohesin domain-containing protein [bacterium]